MMSFQGSDEDTDGKHELREPMESPFPSKISPRGKSDAEKGSKPVKDRLGSDQVASNQQHNRGQRPSRNERGDGPPPDPGYK